MADRLVSTIARRMAVAVTMSILVGFLMMWTWGGSKSALFVRTILIGLSGTAAFSLFEVWPRRLPPWIQRWVLQVAAVGAMMPAATLSMSGRKLVTTLTRPELERRARR